MNYATYEASIELQFGDKVDAKTACINQIMATIDEAISGRAVPAIRGEIEQQVRRAWNEGYKRATKDHAKELVAAGKSAKALWGILEKVSSDYDEEELEEAFGVVSVDELLCNWDLDSFVECFKEYDERREAIHVGDEIKWRATPMFQIEPKEDVFHFGIVLDIKDTYYVVLTSGSLYFYETRVPIDCNTIQKTHRHFDEFAKKEES